MAAARAEIAAGLGMSDEPPTAVQAAAVLPLLKDTRSQPLPLQIRRFWRVGRGCSCFLCRIQEGWWAWRDGHAIHPEVLDQGFRYRVTIKERAVFESPVCCQVVVRTGNVGGMAL
jgi:hypothetical protein